MPTRRDLFRTAAAGVAVVAAPRLFATARAADPAAAGFTLPKLPYAFDALEPHIDAKTMEIHHDRHHKAYVDNLNKALEGKADWLKLSPKEVITRLGELPEAVRTAVRNNGGGHYNHSLFWDMMSAKGGQPTGDLKKAIDESFGGLDGFMKEFKAAALKQFGSGWAWLHRGKEKPLAISTTANQDNPVMVGGPAPVLGVDVWEHAYYLKYQNKRADYVDAWFKVINWEQAAANFAASGKAG